LVQKGSNDWLLGRDRVVAGLVVALCPLGVSGIDIYLGQVSALRIGWLVEPREYLPNLLGASFDVFEGSSRSSA
jgi:hypothetical protein